MYPEDSLVHNGTVETFQSLLETGRIMEALDMRLALIEATANEYRQDVEAARGTSGAFFLATMLLSANPLIGSLGVVAAVAYAYTLYADYQHTQRLFPFPLIRKSFGGLLDSTGAAAFKQKMQADPLEPVTNYLQPKLAHEYEVLYVAQHEIAQILSSNKIAPNHRLTAYRYLLRYSTLAGELNLPEIEVVIEAVAAAGDCGLPMSTTPLPSASATSTTQIQAQANSEAGSLRPAALPLPQPDAIEHANPEVLKAAKIVLQSLALHKAPCQFVGGIDGYKFIRILLRKDPATRIESVFSLDQDLLSELGVDFPELEKPPLISQVKGGAIAIDIAKPKAQWRTAHFRDFFVADSAQRQPFSPLTLPIGVDLDGRLIDVSLNEHHTCHLLIGGVTGGGKSEFAIAAITSILNRYSPGEVRLALSDIQQVTFDAFRSLPHLVAGVARSVQETIKLLQDVEQEMDARQALFVQAEAKNLDQYNASVPEERRLPRIIVWLEEIADCMLCEELCLNPESQEVKTRQEMLRLLQRFAQVGRKWGIHLIASTQSPRKEVVPPLVRSNFPAQMAFAVSRPEESAIILGGQDRDAVNLLGYGDVIFRTSSSSERLQTLLVAPEEVTSSVRSAIAQYTQAEPEEKKQTGEENSSPIPLEMERKRLEFTMSLPWDGDEDGLPSRPSEASVPSDPSSSDPSLPSINGTSEDDWEIFRKIRDGRKLSEGSDGKPARKSKTIICQEIFGCSDGGNSMRRAVAEYERIRDLFLPVWVRELILEGKSKPHIIEEIWGIHALKQHNYKKKKPQEWHTISAFVDAVARTVDPDNSQD